MEHRASLEGDKTQLIKSPIIVQNLKFTVL